MNEFGESKTSKRKRSSNFSKGEELCLLNAIEKYKNIIENKNFDKVSNIEKENAWTKILKEFNSKNLQVVRTIEQIKSKFDNLKTKVRKEIASKKINLTDGMFPNCDLDAVTEAVVRIINVKTHPTDIVETCLGTTVQGSIVEESHYLPPIFNINIKCEPEEPVIHDQEHYEENIPSTSSENISSNLAAQKDHRSRCVSRKLKVKSNRKLRSVRDMKTLLDMKKTYYKRKLEILEKTFRQETELRKWKEERDVEEHEKKMKLLAMDISIREHQLQLKCNNLN